MGLEPMTSDLEWYQPNIWVSARLIIRTRLVCFMSGTAATAFPRGTYMGYNTTTISRFGADW